MPSVKSLIAFLLCFYFASALGEPKDRGELYEELLKALKEQKDKYEKSELKKMVDKALDEVDDVSRLFPCYDLNQQCNIFKHCCGDYKCSAFTGGVCVSCVKQGQKCYRNDQCCPGTKCLGSLFKKRCGVEKSAAEIDN